MRVRFAAALAAFVGLASAPAAAIQTENEIVRCSDVDGIAELAGKMGLAAQVNTASSGAKVVVVMSKGNTPFAIAPVSDPSVGGCFAFLMMAPFGRENVSQAEFYNKFNGSDMGAFGAVALTFEGEIALGHSQLTPYGMIAGNMAAEIGVFAERADAFKRALTTGVVADALPGRKPAGRALTGMAKASPFLSPAVAATARAVLKSKALAPKR
ncbi:MAG: hypothetical protein U1E87_05785 [Alphaproteobacteria bacterium]